MEDKTKGGLTVQERSIDEKYNVEAEKGMIYDMDGIGHKVGIRWFFPKKEILSSHDSNIIMDAQVIKPARNDDIITIRKYKKHAVFVRIKKRGLRQMSKLGF